MDGSFVEVAPGLHSAGTFTAPTFEAIAKATRKLQIRNSVETGSGASTLLFSHLSDCHTVFPWTHAYPFPDLEYYYLYPHLETGALLILDDIHIPTVYNLFEFLRRDLMFHLQEEVGTTAFFTRTSAPTFNQFGDGWRQQKYNARRLFRYTWRGEIKSLLPAPMQRSVARMKRRASQGFSQAKVEILAPQSGATVTNAGLVEGSADKPPDSFLWALARRKDFNGWWPQGTGDVSLEGNVWRVFRHLRRPTR